MFHAAFSRDAVPVVSGPFEPRARLIYWILAAELAASLVCCLAGGFTFSGTLSAAMIAWPSLCVSAMLLRRYGHFRTSGIMEATALMYGQGLAVFFLLWPLTAWSAPLADAKLAAMDRALGFDWPAFAALFAREPLLQHALVVVYRSFNWQPILLILLLFLTGREDRCWKLITASVIAGPVGLVLYFFFPAMGTFHYFSVDPADFPKIHSAWEFGPVIVALKNGARLVTPDMLVGIISFPSFHAAAAAVFVWGAWPTRLRYPFLILNVGLCVSAMICGAHYLVDVLAGIALAGFGVASLNPGQVKRVNMHEPRGERSCGRLMLDFLPSARRGVSGDPHRCHRTCEVVEVRSCGRLVYDRPAVIISK